MSITLDGETADRIAALALTEHREIMVEQLDNENLHDEDRGRYTRYIKAIDTLLNEYFEIPR